MAERAICIFCSSSNSIDPAFFEAARALGEGIAKHGYALVYGGTQVGLMGAVADSVIAHGGKTIGVIPEALHARGIAHPRLDELIITKDMRERKATMERRASAFVGLPGGFGTLEEIFEIITLKQLEYHAKPILLFNVAGYYDPMVALMEHIYAQRFAKPEYRAYYQVAADVAGIFAYLEGYQPPVAPVNKWA
jgi:hypothetical protein